MGVPPAEPPGCEDVTRRPGCEKHLLDPGQDIRTIQELLGYKAVSTTMINTHGLNPGPLREKNLADSLSPVEQLLLGPVNHGYLSREFWKTRCGTRSYKGWPTG